PVLDEIRARGEVRAIGAWLNHADVCLELARNADFDCFLLANRYTLLEQSPLDDLLPLCEARGIGIVAGGPFNSGILATGPVAGATYNYRPAAPEALERVRAIESVCAAFDVPLAAAALQFPLAHPAVSSVICGARSAEEIAANAELVRTAVPAECWRELKGAGLIREDAPTPAAPD
ncbi:MAG: aldo/keto reductase, partial [Gammaproteobacteria bacterium]|nr:aldo/keto reductase [Gammaproteobacteria bacterium]